MTNLEKMNELVESNASKEVIHGWAYMNRIPLCCLHLEQEFEVMEHSVDNFMESNEYSADEHENWSRFLDAPYIGEVSHE